MSARAPHARSLVLPRRSGGGMVRRAARAHVACLLLTAGLLLPVAARAQEVGVEPEEAVWGTARILRIELLGTDGTSFEDLRHLVVVREGEPLSRRDIRRSVQRLYRTGRFANVEAYAEDRVGGVHLRFVLVPRKLLREVRVEGAPFLAGREPAALTDLAPGMDYADDLIEHGMLRLREVLARAGYERAEVQTAVDAGDDSVALHFHVTPHQPTRIARLRFSGERGDRAIVEAFALSRGDVLDLDRLERELD
ncbi:MAG TPA: POTRA domain-containing protein, partial [Fredinandcohnia sp.]|nr:POTRA domain-containing protein [Fredinandcohnia sp.]